jgi:hypothetical protein
LVAKDLDIHKKWTGAYIAMTHGFAVGGFTKFPIQIQENGIEIYINR